MSDKTLAGVGLGALTRGQMADRLCDEQGLRRREAREIVDAFFEAISDALARNEPVKLSGFGNFDLRDKRERPGRNPKTGETVPVAARRIVTFRAGRKLRTRVAANPASADE